MMRGRFIPRRLPTSQSFYPFSTSSSGGGRGRGRGGVASTFNFVSQPPPPPQNPNSPDSKPQQNSESPPEPQPRQPEGLGHGRGRPLPSSYSSFLHPIGRGGPSESTHPPAAESPQSDLPPAAESPQPVLPPPPQPRSRPPIGESPDSAKERNLPQSILSVVGGAGRGVPSGRRGPVAPPVQEENRHIRARPSRPVENRFADEPPRPEEPNSKKRVDPEEAKRRAMEILSRGVDGGGGGGGGAGRGVRGGRGRGMRGGRGGRFGHFRGAGRGEGRGRGVDVGDDGYAEGLYLGDNADGEKLAKRVGPEMMNELTESFEEIGSRVLPSPMDDVYLDAFHTNCMVCVSTLACFDMLLPISKNRISIPI